MAAAQARENTSAARAEARSLADLGDFDGARDALAKAIDVAPSDAELHATMAWYTCKCRGMDVHERERLTEHHLSVSFELVPGNHLAHYWTGRIAEERGNPGRARTSYEAAIEARPDFVAARDALARTMGKTPSPSMVVRGLGGLITPPPVTTAPGRPGGPRVRTPILVATVVALLGGGIGYLLVSAGDRELGALADQLGTRLSLRSASKSKPELHIDAGDSWQKLGTEAQAEVEKIGNAAQGLGFSDVYLYANSHPVAEVHNGQVCLEVGCMKIPVYQETGRDDHGAAPTPPPSGTAGR